VRCPRDLISSLRSPRYAVILRALAEVILRALAEGRAPWAAIRRRLEDYEGRGLNPATVSQLIGTLVKLGVVEEVERRVRDSRPSLQAGGLKALKARQREALM